VDALAGFGFEGYIVDGVLRELDIGVGVDLGGNFDIGVVVEGFEGVLVVFVVDFFALGPEVLGVCMILDIDRDVDVVGDGMELDDEKRDRGDLVSTLGVAFNAAIGFAACPEEGKGVFAGGIADLPFVFAVCDSVFSESCFSSAGAFDSSRAGCSSLSTDFSFVSDIPKFFKPTTASSTVSFNISIIPALLSFVPSSSSLSASLSPELAVCWVFVDFI